MPKSLSFLVLVPSVFCSLAYSLDSAYVTMFSITVLLASFLRKDSLMLHYDPNYWGLSVRVSFVWESKDGFSIWQLMKAHRLCLTYCGLMSRLLCFFLIISNKWLAIWSVTW